MDSLYQISSDLTSIFDKIEAQGGELLPEDEEALVIKQDELNTKLTNYVQYMRSIENDIAACKEEENRIKALRKSRENKVENIKKVMLGTVMRFGVIGKSGNFIVELPTVKLSTRRSESIVGDEVRLEYLKKEIIRLINELDDAAMFMPDMDWDMEALCGTINANVAAEMEADNCREAFVPFTPTDLSLITISYTVKTTVERLFKEDNGAGEAIAKNKSLLIDIGIDKTTAKDYIKACNGDANIVSCCHTEVNQSLQIK